MDKPRPDLKKLAAVLRAERMRRGLTQPKLAAMYGLSQSQISDLEREATRTLSAEVEAFLSNFLGAIPRLELVELPELSGPRAEDPPELQRALELVRQLHRLKSHSPPYRLHDWNVLMALLDAPAVSDRERRRSRKE